MLSSCALFLTHCGRVLPIQCPPGDKEKDRTMTDINYKETVNLPKTDFPMRANLTTNEVETVARWDEIGLYARMREAAAGKPKFVLHDGPPYANGELHAGTALNK